jgi:PAS domain S-box-containing protein
MKHLTNAFKYAFPVDRAGRVAVTFTSDGQGGCELAVDDDGIGMDSTANASEAAGSTGFGLTLIHALADQLAGKAELSASESLDERRWRHTWLPGVHTVSPYHGKTRQKSLPRRNLVDMRIPQRKQLRNRAEDLLSAKPVSVSEDEMDPAEFKRVLHDLRVHQIELELQNEELRNSRNDLELARDGYAKLYNEAPVGYLSIDSNGIITQANRTFMDWVGDNGRLVGSSFASQLDAPDAGAFLGRFSAMFRQPWGKSMDVRMHTPAGQRVMRLLMRRDDREDRMLLAMSDVTEETKAREALRDAENLWSETFEAMSDAVWILGLDEKVIKFNSASLAILGKTSGDAIHGCFCHELLHGTPRHVAECPYLRMKRSGKRETSILREKDRWLEVSVEPLLSGDGRLMGSVHITKDVTERKEAEDRIQALLKEKQLLLRETHHRIKNNMNVIAALLSLQASHMEEGPGPGT